MLEPRWEIRKANPARLAVALAVVGWPLQSLSAQAQRAASQEQAPSTALERIAQSGKIRVGFRTDARPFSFNDGSSNPAGFSVELCTAIAGVLRTDRNLATLNIEWVPVTATDRFRAVQQNRVDLLCAADNVTLGRREEVSFSIPVFPGGIGALLRSDAPARLREVLSQPATTPTPPDSAGQLLQGQTFTVVKGTTAEPWLADRLKYFRLTATVQPVTGYDAGVQQVQNGRAKVFFGDRAILLDAARRNASARNLVMIDRFFTYQPVAVVMARGDEALRLAVDRALSRIFATPGFLQAYVKWFGQPDEQALTFYRWNTLSE